MNIEHKSIAIELKADGEEGRIKGFGSVYGNVDGGKDIVLPGAFAKCIARMKAAGKTPKMLWQHKTDMPIGLWDIFDESSQGLIVEGKIFTETTMGKDAYVLVKGGAINGLSIGYGVRDYSIDSKSGCRLLKELDLYEVSLVTFPMNELATVTAVKSASGDIDTAVSLLNGALAMCQPGMSEDVYTGVTQMIQSALALLDEPEDAEDMSDSGGDAKADRVKAAHNSAREFEEFLREAGYGREAAKVITAKGFKSLESLREAGTQAADVTANAERLASLLTNFKI